MTNTIRRLRLLKRMESNHLTTSLTEEHAEKDLESACDRIENLGLQKKLDAKNCPNTQEELVQVPEFAKLYQVLCEKGIPSSTVEIMVYLAGESQEHLTQYPEEDVISAAVLNIPHQYRFAYMKFLLPQVRFEEEEQSIATNLRYLSDTVLLQLSDLTEQQKALLRKPFLSYSLDNWHRLDWAELETLEKNQPLQEMLMMLYQWGVDLSLNAASLRALSWLQWEDIPKIRRLRKIFAYDTKDLSKFFAYWLENHAAQYDLNWFLSCWEPLDQERREAILCNRISYLNALYSGRLRIDFERVKEHQVPILIYAVEKRKNHFLNMVSQHSEQFFSLSRQALLFEDGFCEYCNLNSLSEQNLRCCDTTDHRPSHFEFLENGQQYTFEEMHLLWHQRAAYVRLYAKLTALSVDQRLLSLRQLLARDLVEQSIDDGELEQLAECLLRQTLSVWRQKEFQHIHGLSAKTAVKLLQNYKAVMELIPDLHTETDAVFAVNNFKRFPDGSSWESILASIAEYDSKWTELKSEMRFSEEFVTEHQERIVNFLMRGGSEMVWSLYDYLRWQYEKGVEALRRIVQAELMGKFYTLKYFREDLQREIRYPISNEQEEKWKDNMMLTRGILRAEEVDDFYHTVQLGVLPSSTCLSYRTGSYRECLLAAFDSNKKMILIQQGDEVVGRACLRLTKGGFQKPSALAFGFADLAQTGGSTETVNADTQERLVLFLERMYTSHLNKDEEQRAYQLAVSLVTKKAAGLGATAVLAKCYAACCASDQYFSAPFFVYISKSKNGLQYLDSLGGAATTSEEEKYVESAFMIRQAEE